MPNTFDITFKPPLRDVSGRFAKASKALTEKKRDEVRLLGKRWVQIAREEAPQGKTGRFRRSLNYRSFEEGGDVGFRAISAQPLGTFIIMGTKPHEIKARRAGALFFFWQKIGRFVVVPKGGGFRTHVADGKLWVGKGHVDHPGTQPNPYNVRTYEQWKPEAQQAMRRIGRDWIITMSSGAPV